MQTDHHHHFRLDDNVRNTPLLCNLTGLTSLLSELPGLPGDQARLARYESNSGQPTPPSLLLLNNEELVVESTSLQLLEYFKGLQLRTARTGSVALSLAAECPPDLLLCDLERPGETGIEFIKTFKAAHPESLILVTSGHTHGELVASISAGATAAIQLPFHFAEFVQAVRLMLNMASFSKVNAANPP